MYGKSLVVLSVLDCATSFLGGKEMKYEKQEVFLWGKKITI
jgi:hypothetical protein